MEVILLESVGKLGSFGDTVKVKAGFARNYLVPQNKALPATKPNIKYFEEKQQEFQDKLKLKQGEAQNRADLLKDRSVRIEMNAHDDGKLYGSVGIREILSLLTEQGIEVAKHEVQLPDGAIRQAGEYQLRVQITPEIGVDIPMEVVAIQQNQTPSQPEEITHG